VQTKLKDDSIDLNRIFATKPVAFIRTGKKAAGAAVQGVIVFRLTRMSLLQPDALEATCVETKNARREAPGISH
jgi:hypothetical protein